MSDALPDDALVATIVLRPRRHARVGPAQLAIECRVPLSTNSITMNIITSINAKGGCGKSTLASNVAAGFAKSGRPTLLVDLDPQAQITGWYGLGDQISVAGSITAVLNNQERLADVVRRSHLPNLDFVASSAPLEELGQQLRGHDGYQALLVEHLLGLGADRYDYVVIDSPNQVSPVMKMGVYATDLFLVPFLDTHSVLSFPNVYSMIQDTRPAGDFLLLPVINNLSNKPRKRGKVLAMLPEYKVDPADAVEVRYCAALGEVDTEGGSVFEYYPSSNGAADIGHLCSVIGQRLTEARAMASEPEQGDRPAEADRAETSNDVGIPDYTEALPDNSEDHEQTTPTQERAA